MNGLGDSISLFDFLSGSFFCDEQNVRKFGKVFVDFVFSLIATIIRQPNVQRNDESLRVFADADAGRDFPVLQVFVGEFFGGRVHDGHVVFLLCVFCRDFLVFELVVVEGVLRDVCDLNDFGLVLVVGSVF